MTAVRWCLPLLLLLGACSTAPSDREAIVESPVAGVPIGEVRGVADITSTLRTRLLDDADPRTASFDVARVAGPVFRLRKQLGVFASQGTTTTYQGGLPTPLRATLWHQIFGRFADALGERCTAGAATNEVTFPVYADGADGTSIRPVTFRLAHGFAGTVATACAFEGDEASRRQASVALFDAIMGGGQSLAAERASLEGTFAADGAVALGFAPKQRVAEMVLAILTNPHFLLAK
jgi:hypothetical protein